MNGFILRDLCNAKAVKCVEPVRATILITLQKNNHSDAVQTFHSQEHSYKAKRLHGTCIASKGLRIQTLEHTT